MNILKYIPLALGMVLLLGSCSDDDYAPGYPVDENCVGVYVSNDNESAFALNPEQNHTSVSIKVNRLNTSGAVAVPVTVSSDYSGYNAPATVDFADGEATAIYTIDFPGIASGSMAKVSISFPDEYVNPYKMTDGISDFLCSVSVFPIVISESVDYEFNHDFGTVTGGKLIQTGFNEYTLSNIIGSGVDVNFSLGNYAEGYYDYVYGNAIEPLSGCRIHDGDYYNCWSLYDSANGCDRSWTPEGTNTEIESIYFYGYDSEYNYSYINIKNKSGLLVGMVTGGGNVEDYNEIKFSWK